MGGGAIAEFSFSEAECKNAPSNEFCVEYRNNETLSGDPVYVTREPTINHNWGNGGIGNGVGNDNFSARWIGKFNFSAGNHTFTTRTDDGVRVYVDDVLVINNWNYHPETVDSATVNLIEGEHVIRLEFFEGANGAIAILNWN
jgi:hypothetical protein